MEEKWVNAVWYNGNKHEWFDLKGMFQVSNLGRVKSLLRGTETILKQHKRCKEWDYLCVKLFGHTMAVHKLVAFAFPEICGEYFDGAVVNHKNEIPTDNRADNLEWCSAAYNNKYGHRTEKTSRPVLQMKNGVIIKKWDSVRKASRYFGLGTGQIINCCKHKKHFNSAAGFQWEYA